MHLTSRCRARIVEALFCYNWAVYSGEGHNEKNNSRTLYWSTERLQPDSRKCHRIKCW
ncbi:hypothetical protein THOE12_150106 [Vibrio rotiferianus]|nr:hypothetical protein THOE12_150106 [Vibrio rotiferianus]